jgi:hypothetical protein
VTFPFPPRREPPLPDPQDPPEGRQLGLVMEREMRTPPAPPWTLGARGKLLSRPQLFPMPWREAEWIWLKLWLEFMVPSVFGIGLDSALLPGTAKLSCPKLPCIVLCPLLWEFPSLTTVPTRSYHCATCVSSWSILKCPWANRHCCLEPQQYASLLPPFQL